MLLRICLAVAILAGAGVIAVSHFKVRPQIEGIIAERQKNADDRDTEKKAKVKAQGELKATTAKLKETETILTDTQTQLAASKSQAEAEQKRANDFKGKFEKTSQDLNEARQKLEAWAITGVQPDQVKALVDSEKNLRASQEVLKQEMRILIDLNKRLTNMIAVLTGGGDVDPVLPAGLKGRVLVVDPKWNFVILDVGEKQGAQARGVLMISRGSKLVAKVRIMSVQSERSIANIMPGWKLGEVLEGDLALY